MNKFGLATHFEEIFGSLFDKRVPSYWDKLPLRQHYSAHHHVIDTTSKLKQCLRAGQYAWPGGYECFFVTRYGDILSFEAVKENFKLCIAALREHNDDQWWITGMESSANIDGGLRCSHTDKWISAYQTEEEAAAEEAALSTQFEKSHD